MQKQLDLSPFRKNNYSQFGEDGVIAKLFEILKIKTGWLVEVGAWDGVHLSNIRCHYIDSLNVAEKDFKVMFIESNYQRFNELKHNYPEKTVSLVNMRIGTSIDDRGLDVILAAYDVKDLALLSLDVDGEEREIWQTVALCEFGPKPKIVIIEEGKWQQPQELEELVTAFTGYNLVCVTGNFIFVRNDLGITSKQTVHELLASSGSPEYNLFHRNINKQQYDDIVFRLEHGDKDIMSRLAGPQIIYYDEE